MNLQPVQLRFELQAQACRRSFPQRIEWTEQHGERLRLCGRHGKSLQRRVVNLRNPGKQCPACPGAQYLFSRPQQFMAGVRTHHGKGTKIDPCVCERRRERRMRGGQPGLPAEPERRGQAGQRRQDELHLARPPDRGVDFRQGASRPTAPRQDLIERRKPAGQGIFIRWRGPATTPYGMAMQEPLEQRGNQCHRVSQSGWILCFYTVLRRLASRAALRMATAPGQSWRAARSILPYAPVRHVQHRSAQCCRHRLQHCAETVATESSGPCDNATGIDETTPSVAAASRRLC